VRPLGQGPCGLIDRRNAAAGFSASQGASEKRNTTKKNRGSPKTDQPAKSDSLLVRASRDGDQFHYLWAARRCLRLLSPSSGLVAVTIEGASSAEFSNGEAVQAGEELIDVGEYYGSQDVTQASLVRYIQIKHSTLHANDAWPPSGLQKTLGKFAQRYTEIRNRLGPAMPVVKFEFWFVSNRPIGTDFLEAIEDAAGAEPARHPGEQLIECFRPFIEHLVSSEKSRRTIQEHVDNMWALGGQFITELNYDPTLRKRPVDRILKEMIRYGGPLLRHADEEQQASFDTTCEVFRRFLVKTARRCAARSTEKRVASMRSRFESRMIL
jgi:hypothetical protein